MYGRHRRWDESKVKRDRRGRFSRVEERVHRYRIDPRYELPPEDQRTKIYSREEAMVNSGLIAAGVLAMLIAIRRFRRWEIMSSPPPRSFSVNLLSKRDITNGWMNTAGLHRGPLPTNINEDVMSMSVGSIMSWPSRWKGWFRGTRWAPRGDQLKRFGGPDGIRNSVSDDELNEMIEVVGDVDRNLEMVVRNTLKSLPVGHLRGLRIRLGDVRHRDFFARDWRRMLRRPHEALAEMIIRMRSPGVYRGKGAAGVGLEGVYSKATRTAYINVRPVEFMDTSKIPGAGEFSANPEAAIDTANKARLTHNVLNAVADHLWNHLMVPRVQDAVAVHFRSMRSYNRLSVASSTSPIAWFRESYAHYVKDPVKFRDGFRGGKDPTGYELMMDLVFHGRHYMPAGLS